MVTLHKILLTGRITESGELKIDDLPEGLPPGAVQVTIEVPVEEETSWTDEELQEMRQVTPKTGAEIAAELKAGLGDSWKDITVSGAEWVEEQRQKRARKFSEW
jgi:hypothetical protein